MFHTADPSLRTWKPYRKFCGGFFFLHPGEYQTRSEGIKSRYSFISCHHHIIISGISRLLCPDSQCPSLRARCDSTHLRSTAPSPPAQDWECCRALGKAACINSAPLGWKTPVGIRQGAREGRPLPAGQNTRTPSKSSSQTVPEATGFQPCSQGQMLQ